MTPRPLPEETVRRLRVAPFSYPEVGGTRRPLPPAGFRVIDDRVTLGAGGRLFDRAVAGLLSWQLHRAAGLGVEASAEVIRDDTTVALLKFGPLRMPVRVAYVRDEPGVRGFAYGTLPGHAEAGEEAFLVEHRPDDTVGFRIVGFSRPASRLARAGGPVTTWVQSAITGRYLGGMARWATMQH